MALPVSRSRLSATCSRSRSPGGQVPELKVAHAPAVRMADTNMTIDQEWTHGCPELSWILAGGARHVGSITVLGAVGKPALAVCDLLSKATIAAAGGKAKWPI